MSQQLLWSSLSSGCHLTCHGYLCYKVMIHMVTKVTTDLWLIWSCKFGRGVFFCRHFLLCLSVLLLCYLLVFDTYECLVMDLLQKQNKIHPPGMCRCVMWYIRVHGITSQKPVTSVLSAATTSKLNAQGRTYMNPFAPTSAHSTKFRYHTVVSI